MAKQRTYEVSFTKTIIARASVRVSAESRQEAIFLFEAGDAPVKLEDVTILESAASG